MTNHKFKLVMLVILLMGCTNKTTINSAPTNSFSTREVELAEEVDIPPAQFLKTSDNISLAYREYIPDKIKAILIFYHGGGSHSAAGYQHLGTGLKNDYDILVVTPDIRGHGESSGKRGDAPSPESVYVDINRTIKHIRKEYPNKPIYLGGHSSGAGLLINYSSYKKSENTNGYVLLSPYLGYRSKTEYITATPFARAKTNLFIKNAIHGIYGNEKAVFFNYPAALIKKDPRFLPAITVNMANAQTPSLPATQIKNIDQPLAVWIGQDDEIFNPDKVISFINNNNPNATTQITQAENHLSILLTASSNIGPWIGNDINQPHPNEERFE